MSPFHDGQPEPVGLWWRARCSPYCLIWPGQRLLSYGSHTCHQPHSRQRPAVLYSAGESDIDIESLEVSGVRDTVHRTAGQPSSQPLLWSDSSDNILAKYFIGHKILFIYFIKL